jgi:hypothetical protein
MRLEQPGGGSTSESANPALNPNNPLHITLPTFRMVVLADELLESARTTIRKVGRVMCRGLLGLRAGLADSDVERLWSSLFDCNGRGN